MINGSIGVLQNESRFEKIEYPNESCRYFSFCEFQVTWNSVLLIDTGDSTSVRLPFAFFGINE